MSKLSEKVWFKIRMMICNATDGKWPCQLCIDHQTAYGAQAEIEICAWKHHDSFWTD